MSWFNELDELRRIMGIFYAMKSLKSFKLSKLMAVINNHYI